MKNYARTVLLILLVISCLQGMSGQTLSFPALKGYDMHSDYPVYTPDDLWNYINGAADAYLALGFLDLNITEYKKGKKIIKAEIYRFANDAQAFGIYSLERSPEYHYISVGVQGYNEDGVVNFYKGCYYIKIMTHSASVKVNADMRTLASKIAERTEGAAGFPDVLKMFPADGLLKNWETYILESVLGHDYLKGAFRASYEVDGDNFEIYLFDRPSVEEAVKTVALLTGITVSSDDDITKLTFEDGYNGLLYIMIKGTRVIVISGLTAGKADIAGDYLNMMTK